jgi:hypothetical protein
MQLRGSADPSGSWFQACLGCWDGSVALTGLCPDQDQHKHAERGTVTLQELPAAVRAAAPGCSSLLAGPWCSSLLAPRGNDCAGVAYSRACVCCWLQVHHQAAIICMCMAAASVHGRAGPKWTCAGQCCVQDPEATGVKSSAAALKLAIRTRGRARLYGDATGELLLQLRARFCQSTLFIRSLCFESVNWQPTCRFWQAPLAELSGSPLRSSRLVVEPLLPACMLCALHAYGSDHGAI